MFGTLITALSAAAQRVLSSSELAMVESGQQVVRSEPVPNSAWPRVTIHRFIAATPVEAAAIFADYPRHATYLPGVTSAWISRQATPLVAEVDYVLDVPLFPDEPYTVRDSISRSDDGATYRIEWAMIRARSTRAISGSAQFVPHRNARTGAEGTLLIYDNLVVPGQALAGPLKGRALAQVRETVAALATEIERVRREDPDRVAAQARLLINALDRRP